MSPLYVPSVLLRSTEKGFLFNCSNAESYSLNETGLTIVNALISGRSSQTIWKDLVEEYEVDEEEARRDVDGFFEHLRSLGLVREADIED